uniref:Uncharacterized protein n=1 Tax=Bombyx mori TaxID=7091 RepID=A0A8R2HPC6_BOMMO|nr:uncharacterized protein LOC110385870 [Bombyx mori]
MRYCRIFTIIIFTAKTAAARISTEGIEYNNQNDKQQIQRNASHYKSIENSNGQKLKSRCCPYDFDSSRCKIVDDRVLCGYNRNVGSPKTKENIVDLHGGCRLRGGRLECGYQTGPFTNSRRPPATWKNLPNTQNDVQYEDHKIETQKESSSEKNDAFQDIKRLKMINTHTTKGFGEAITRCIEVRDRVVCKQM